MILAMRNTKIHQKVSDDTLRYHEPHRRKRTSVRTITLTPESTEFICLSRDKHLKCVDDGI